MTDKKTEPDAKAEPATTTPDADVKTAAAVTTSAPVRRRKDAAAATTPPAAAAPPAKGLPRRPRFPMAEGTREELERTGRAVDPFTGEVLEDAEKRKAYLAAAKARGESVPREA
jgi:hypothetical protein